MHRPRLLLLDEPTVGVDPQSRNHIFQEVRARNQAGLTVLYTSHYVEEVQALCRRIGIMDQGKLVACDTLQGLLRHLLRVRVVLLPCVAHPSWNLIDRGRSAGRGLGSAAHGQMSLW